MKLKFILPFVFICHLVQTGSSQRITGCLTPPEPGPISGPNTVKGSSVNSYSIPTDNGATAYIWSISATTSATITSGQGTTNITISIAPVCVSFTVCVLAQNSCGNSHDTCFNVNCIQAGIENETAESLDYKITPSAGNGQFDLTVYAPVIDNPEIKIYNILGQEVYTYSSTSNFSGFSKNINLSSFSNGIYILNFQANQGSFRKKIVISK